MEISLDNAIDNTYNLYQRAFEIMRFDQPSEEVLHQLHNDWDEVARCQRGLSLVLEYNDGDNLEFYYNKMRAVYPKIFEAYKRDKNNKPENK